MRITDVSKLKGPLGELNDQLLGDNGEERLVELNLWLKRVVKKLLKHVKDIALGSIDRFVASEKFTKNNTKVKFYRFCPDFEKNFSEKVESGIAAETIVVHRLEQSARDTEIMAELGPEKCVIKLAQFYEVLARNTSGLFVANIENVNGIVWAVYAIWDAGSRGWLVFARSVTVPGGWRAGGRVVSRKSA